MQKRPIRTTSKLFFTALLGLGAVLVALFSSRDVFAASLGSQIEEGLNYATAAGLGTRDIREVIFFIINIALGFLGVVAVVILLYGGFLWMTAGGDADRLRQAKRLIVNALIGLVIIFTSYAIAAFIVRQLVGIAGPGGGVGPDGQPPGGGDGGDVACIPRVTSPTDGTVSRIYNIVVRVTFNQGVDLTSVNQDNFSIQVANGLAGGRGCDLDEECASDECSGAPAEARSSSCVGETVRGDYVLGAARTVEFRPYRDCGPQAPGRKCFSQNTAYRVALLDGAGDILCRNGESIACGLGAFPTCPVFQFTTGDILDITDPELDNLSGRICEDSNMITVNTRDNTEVASLVFRANGSEVSEVSGSFGANGVWQTIPLGLWNPDFTAGQDVTIAVEARDVDDNSETLSGAFRVRPNTCCNGILDAGETRIDCGGACGACSGEACDANPDPAVCLPNSILCASGSCGTDCVCVEPPIIDYIAPATDNEGGAPDNDVTVPSTFDNDRPFGARGNIITIFGRNFGARGAQSRVDFWNPSSGAWEQARIAEDVPGIVCQNTWTNERIFVEVPVLAGAALGVLGPVRVTADNGFTDATDDVLPGERTILDFRLTSDSLPGLCQAEPDRGRYLQNIVLRGTNLTSIDRVRFGAFEAARDFVIPLAGDPERGFVIRDVEVPNLQAGTVAWITVSDNGRDSNPIPFSILTSANVPIIYGYTPDNTDPLPDGAEGDYVTITGANFGRRGPDSTVVFLGNIGDDNDDISGDLNFPEECRDDVWSEGRIIVKVPAGAIDGHIKVVRSDGAQGTTLDSGLLPFTIGGEIKPGICRLMPVSGPAGTTPVTFYGERFTLTDEVQFYNAPAISQAGFDLNRGGGTRADAIETTVPSQAQTGETFMRIAAGAESNAIPFTVGACSSNASCPDPLTQECCLSGQFANSCVPLGQCVGVQNRGAYRWSFTAGNLGPRVINDCERTRSCSQICQNTGLTEPGRVGRVCRSDVDCGGVEGDADNECTSPISSPAPIFPRDRDIAVNAVISATFSETMNIATLTFTGDETGSIIVRECGASDPGDSAPCAGAGTRVVSELDFFPVGEREYNGRRVHFIQLVPRADLEPITPVIQDFKAGTWYQVQLKAGAHPNAIRSSIQIPLNGNRGAESDYLWRFKMRNDARPGNIGCVDCSPKNTVLRELYNGGFTGCASDDTDCKLLQGQVYDQDNVCVQLNADSRRWEWSVPAGETRVDVDDSAAGGANDSQAYVLARGQTSPDSVLVSARLETGHQTQCFVRVDLESPVVSQHFPRCGSACADAGIRLVFSKFMNHASVINNTFLYTCGGDFSCTNLHQINAVVACADDADTRKTTCDILPQTTFTINDLTYRLVPGNYYRVVVRDFSSGAQSTEGRPLANLNYDDPLFFAFVPASDSFSYIFRVTTDTNICQLNRVVVIPVRASVNVDGKKIFRADPYSSRDICEPETGQLLDAFSYDWEWEVRDEVDGDPDPGDTGAPNEIADFHDDNPSFAQGQDACGNGVVELGEDCDDGNNDSGDGCRGTDNVVGGVVVGACLNEGTVAPVCGNGQRDNFEECDDGNTVDGDGCSARCLLEGVSAHPPYPVCGNGILEQTPSAQRPQEIEECDDGNLVSGDGCDESCVLEGSRRGRSLCGDGIVGFGEYCEVCGSAGSLRTIVIGSCPDSQFAQGRPSAGSPLLQSAECDTSCKNRNPVPISVLSPVSVCGNGRIEPGEECETASIPEPNDNDSDGCTDVCLRSGSVQENIDPNNGPRIGPAQIVRGIRDGIAKIIATAQKIGRFASSLRVDGEAALRVGTGVPDGDAFADFFILSHQPNGGNNCQNQNAVVVFSAPLDTATLQQNNTVLVTKDGNIFSDYVIQFNTTGETMMMIPQLGLWPEGRYRINIDSPSALNGTVVASSAGQALECTNGNCEWEFEIVNRLCRPTSVDVIPSFANVSPGEWTQSMTVVPTPYSAFAYDTYVAPQIDAVVEVVDAGANNTAEISGSPYCNENAKICIKALDNQGRFRIFAKTQFGDCTQDESVDAVGIPLLEEEGILERETLLIGCGIFFEFDQNFPEQGDIWSVILYEGFYPQIPVDFVWSVTEFTNDEGDPAVAEIQAGPAMCQGDFNGSGAPDNVCWDFRSVDPESTIVGDPAAINADANNENDWAPFTGYRHARVVASVARTPEINGSGDFYVGNMCEDTSDLDDSLALEMNFDSAAFEDTSGNRHDGSCSSAERECPEYLSDDPVRGGVFEFDGVTNLPTARIFGLNGWHSYQGGVWTPVPNERGDWVDAGQVLPSDVASPFTMVAWVKVRVQDNTWHTIIGTDESSAQIALNYDLQPAFGQNGGERYGLGRDGLIISPMALIPEQWYLIVGVYDGVNGSLYVNGASMAGPSNDNGNPLIKNTLADNATPVTHGSTHIGRYFDNEAEYFHGAIDGVRIWNRALSEFEIAQLMQCDASISRSAPEITQCTPDRDLTNNEDPNITDHCDSGALIGCSNPLVSVTFDKAMDAGSVLKKDEEGRYINIRLCESTVDCGDSGNNLATSVSFNRQQKTARITAVRGDALTPGSTYRVRVYGGFEGIKSSEGIPLADANGADGFTGYEWTFSVDPNARVCSCDIMRVDITRAGVVFPDQNDDFYTCAGNGCPDDTDTGAPSNGNQHHYQAQCFDARENQPIIGVEYQWSERDTEGVIQISTDPTVDAIDVTNTSVQGVGFVIVQGEQNDGQGRITRARKSIFVNNFICNNPWPNVGNVSYDDVLGGDNNIFPYTNFSFQYCRDTRNTSSAADDLPALQIQRPRAPGSIKSFIFPNVFHQSRNPLRSEQFDADIAPDWTLVEDTECVYTTRRGAELSFDDWVISENGQYQIWVDVFNYEPTRDAASLGLQHVLQLAVDGVQRGEAQVNALSQTQRVYFDAGYLASGRHDFRIMAQSGFIWPASPLRLAVCEFGMSESARISDAVGVRVFENPLHLNPWTWYQSGICSEENRPTVPRVNPQLSDVCFADSDCVENSACVFNVPNRGEFTQLEVDSYPAIQSGRTVYVNAANLDGNTLYTNIYLLSYNENASGETIAIYNQLLEQWRFFGNIADPEDFEKVRRDVRRFGDMQELELALARFKERNGYSPLWDNVRRQFSGGTYIPGLTLSVWPSWSAVLGRQLGVSIAQDPSNIFAICPPACCGEGTCDADTRAFCNANENTCWDEARLELYCPETRFIYGYRSLGAEHVLGTTFEYTGLGGWLSTLGNVLPQEACSNVRQDDLDGDGVMDANDNCAPQQCQTPLECSNPSVVGPFDCDNDGNTTDPTDIAGGAEGQCDRDNDGQGDVCDLCPDTQEGDTDNDGICTNIDNCSDAFNPDQRDSDGNGEGDACDRVCQNDSDSDGVCDERDNCPFVSNPGQENFDGSDNNVPVGLQYPPFVPRYCAPGSPDASTVGDVCVYDDFCGGNAGENQFCRTPDSISGQVWPNGQDFGDACDPNTDHDNDGYATGFCGGYTSNDRADMRLCNSDADCLGFGAAVREPERCLRLSASTAAQQDNCSISSGVRIDILPDDNTIFNAGTYVTTFNPGQEDVDDDLVGYLCDTCIDADNDMVTDSLVNFGFEGSLGQWRSDVSTQQDFVSIVSYRHLDDVAWEERTAEDTVYRGYGAASLRADNGTKKMVFKTLLPGPTQLSSEVLSRVERHEERIQYTALVKIRTLNGSTVSLRVMRGCTNNRAERLFEIPYSARCRGGADVFFEGTTEGLDSRMWNELKGEFYVNFDSAQNDIAFVVELQAPAGAQDSVYVDDFQIVYATNIARERGISCAAEIADNCGNFRNARQCVGGPRHGQGCASDAECTVAGAPAGRCIQPDFDEDNIGDACDRCTDRDGDTFGDPGFDIRACRGSLSRSDNCPVTVNTDQADYDDDASSCNYINPLPYNPLSAQGLDCKNPLDFNPALCSFCGGDACDLDADADTCYNWEQLRKNPNHQFDLPQSSELPQRLLYREEGYLQTATSEERNWLSFSSDTDNDGLPSDCDAQTCGNGAVETGPEAAACQEFSIGLRQCEECDLNDFGIQEPEDITRYMVNNFCASCNTLQCTLNTLRTCLPLDEFVFEPGQSGVNEILSRPENRADVLWSMVNRTVNSRQPMQGIVATEGVAGRSIGDALAPVGTYGINEGGNTNGFGVFHDSVSDGRGSNNGLVLWQSFADVSASSGSDEGVVRELTLDRNDYTIRQIRACDQGVSDSGVERSAIDLFGNHWARQESGTAAYMQLTDAHDPDPDNPDPDTGNPAGCAPRAVFTLNTNFSPHRMKVDTSNQLWMTYSTNNLVKVNLDHLYTNLPLNSASTILLNAFPATGQCELTLPGSPIEVNTVCNVFVVPNAGEMVFDTLGNIWIARDAPASNVLYHLPINATSQAELQTHTITEVREPKFLEFDIEGNLWVGNNIFSDGTSVKSMVKIIPESFTVEREVTFPGSPTTLYGIAADTAGYIWGITSLLDAHRFSIEEGLYIDSHPFAQNVFVPNTNWQTSISTGLSPRIIANFQDALLFEIPVELSAVNTVSGRWSGRWGKILYDVTPATALDSIQASVSLAADAASVGQSWISVEEFNSRIGQEPTITLEEYVADTSQRGEITGQYMKLRFRAPFTIAAGVRVHNIRITCRDSAGRNICR